jgi:predicted nucleic acid-binding protein
MRLLDTMVLIASLDTEHPLHKRAIHHLRRASSEDVYVPSAAVLEMDLELKSHEFSGEERREASTSLLGYVGRDKVLPLSFEVVVETIELESVSGYFDALIGSTAKLHEAIVVSKDTAFTKMGVKIEW